MTRQMSATHILVAAGLIALTALTAVADPPRSALFPICWGGPDNEAVHLTHGALQYQLLLYANPNESTPLTDVRLIFECPTEAAELVRPVISNGRGPENVKTEFEAVAVERDGQARTRYTIPMWDIEAGFGPKGERPWGRWPGWWSILYLRGRLPGRYTMHWHLESAEGNEPEQAAALRVLDALDTPPLEHRAPGRGVGFWAYDLSRYVEIPEVTEGLVQTLADCGLSRVYLQSAAPDTVARLQAHGIEVCLTNAWRHSLLGPGEPPDDARVHDAKLEPITGSGWWCPTYVAQRDDAWEEIIRSRVTRQMASRGFDGFMLDYEGAPAAPAKDVCFCDRCLQAFAEEIGVQPGDLSWPDDVRPGGRLHERWLKWRCGQGAAYVRNVAELAREGRAGASVYTWSAGYYEPYMQHDVYTRSCSDITQFAPFLTAPTVGTYVYPGDPAKELAEHPPGLGTDPQEWGGNLRGMIQVIAWTVDAVRPTPVIPCVAGAHYPGGSVTPLSSVELLRYQAANHLLDGATGVDFWGAGPLEDGRYLALIAELAGLFDSADEYLGLESEPVTDVRTDAESWRAGVLRAADGSALTVIVNGDLEPRDFVIPCEAPSASDALDGAPLPVQENTIAISAPALGYRAIES
ncbi:MAG: hypothetical protein ACP5KN_03625 [Armatimonadota bacterium]